MLDRLSRRRAICVSLLLIIYSLAFTSHAQAQKRRGSGGSMRAVVIDERLAALRTEPRLTAPLDQRLSRGRQVTIIGEKRGVDGVNFYRVAVTSRTRGWLQAESVASPTRPGDDERLLRLIRGSEDFDRVERACIFLDTFHKSSLRPTVLLLHAEAAEEFADKLSREAGRRLNEREMAAGGAPVHSYFMNYNGLDRFNRAGITFVFDPAAKRFHYDGTSWREIIRRYPQSPEAEQARARLNMLNATHKQ